MKTMTTLALATLLLVGTSLLAWGLVSWVGYCRALGIPLLV